MGQAHSKATKEQTEVTLAAICDINPTVAASIGQQHGVPFFTSHRDLIKSKLCDAVIVSTPHPERPRIVMDAMKAGLHVISEKPLSERVSTADKMLALAKETGVAFGVMFQRRLEPALAKAISIARSGQLGKIHRVTMISPEYRSQAYYDSGGWRATWSGEGGGVMMNQSPHILDLFVLLGGKPKTVFGRVEIRLHHIEVEDLAEAMLTYPDGGTGYFYCSTCEAGPGQMIEVFGDQGKLCWRDGQLKYWQFTPGIAEFTRTTTKMWGGPECKEVPITLEPAETGHAIIVRNFARHLRYGEPLISPATDGIYSLEIANAVWLSSHLGKPVELPLSRAAYDRFLARKRRESTFVKQTTDRRETDTQFVKK
jgi:predicted dehydrogenase